jgi:hypothetical protein
MYRAYDPTHARWLNRDPIGETGGDNLYAYVGGSPVSSTDPLGLFDPRPLTIAERIAMGEEVAGGGPEDPIADVAALVTIAVGAIIAEVSPTPSPAPGGAGAGNKPPSPPVATGGSGCPPSGPGKGIDPNKLNHLFGKPMHNLDPLLQQYGSQEAAYNAIDQALNTQLSGGTGNFQTIVNVGGNNVTVTGAYVNGVPRIGTAYIP